MLAAQGFINAFVFAGLAAFFSRMGSSGFVVAAVFVLALLFAAGGIAATQGKRWVLVAIWAILLLGGLALLVVGGGFPGLLEGGIVALVWLAYVLAGLAGALALPAKKMSAEPVSAE